MTNVVEALLSVKEDMRKAAGEMVGEAWLFVFALVYGAPHWIDMNRKGGKKERRHRWCFGYLRVLLQENRNLCTEEPTDTRKITQSLEEGERETFQSANPRPKDSRTRRH